MDKPVVVMALYRPKPGKAKELEALLEKHFPVLQEYGLTTQKKPFVGRSQDGSYVEVFEWASEGSSRKAHDHPGVAKIWEAMGVISDFGTLAQLPEASKPFPHFAQVQE